MLQMLGSITQTLKSHSKSKQMGSSKEGPSLDELKQLEIMSTASMEKIREIESIGSNFLDSVQNQKQKITDRFEGLKT